MAPAMTLSKANFQSFTKSQENEIFKRLFSALPFSVAKEMFCRNRARQGRQAMTGFTETALAAATVFTKRQALINPEMRRIKWFMSTHLPTRLGNITKIPQENVDTSPHTVHVPAWLQAIFSSFLA